VGQGISKADREVAKLLDEADPAALELAKLVAEDIATVLNYTGRRKLKVLVEHFPNTLLAAL